MEINSILKETILLNSSISKKLDLYVTNQFDISSEILMFLAGNSIFQKYKKIFSKQKEIIILCGLGNNGCDGMVLSYLCSTNGFANKVFITKENKSKEFNYFYNLLKKNDQPIYELNEFNKSFFLEKPSALIIEALLGSGARYPLKKNIQSIIEEIYDKKLYPELKILAIDLATGNDFYSQKWNVLPDFLAEIGSKKLENIILKNEVKKYTFHDIGFPLRHFLNSQSIHPDFLFNKISGKKILKTIKRNKNANKYLNGSVIFIGGSKGMTGAILNSYKIFHILGGGISNILTPSSSTSNKCLTKDSSVMIDLLDNNWLNRPFTKKTSTIVVGPGLAENENFILKLIKEKKYVLDAGGLSYIKNQKLNPNILLTPHTGEFKRLFNIHSTNLSENWELAKEKAIELNCYILLKDSFSCLFSPTGDKRIWNYPNSKLSVMGTGDLLSGLLGFFLSRDFSIIHSVHASFCILEYSTKVKTTNPTVAELIQFVQSEI